MADAKDPKLALFELYLATAEKVSDRRAQANSWMLSGAVAWIRPVALQVGPR